MLKNKRRKRGVYFLIVGVLQFFPDLGEGGVLALLLQHQQPPLQQRRRVGMHVAPGVGVLQVLAALVVLPRRGVGVFLLLIHPAGGDAVAEHLCHVFLGILHPPMYTLPSSRRQ